MTLDTMTASAETNGHTNGHTNGQSNGVPEKTRELLCHHMDSTVWNELEMRPDDIVISTYAKSGTTWMQQIVAQLIHQGDPAIRAGTLSLWPDIRIADREEVLSVLKDQKHRRFMKTHLPRDALKWDPDAKYIFVARDGRDMIWSAHHHLRSYTPEFFEMLNAGDFDGPKCVRPSEDPRELFLTLLGPEGGPSQFWPYWSHTRDWWAAKDHPNLLLVHYNDLTADLEGEMRRIAEFLGTPELAKEQWEAAVEHSTFKWMKANAEVPAPPIAAVAFDGGARTFINKGTNSRWKDKLSEEDLRAYNERAKQELGEECAHWLEHGRLGSK